MTKSNVVEVGSHDALERVALSLYGNFVATNKGAYPDRNAVHKAFVHAKVFVETSALIASGELPCHPPQPEAREYVKVPLVKMISEGEGGIMPRFEQLIDPMTQNPLYEQAAVDFDAYAPNLPAEHPINLRYKPRPGAMTVVEMQAENAANRTAEAERRAKSDKQQGLLEKLGLLG